jgi:pimeloyl-ACP methyl ester carboxylesterase
MESVRKKICRAGCKVFTVVESSGCLYPPILLGVLDWGGSGRAVVLLAGSGNMPHFFDDFAPKLAGPYHVYIITRLGFGSASHPDSGYAEQRLADDVLQVTGSNSSSQF